MIYTLCVMIYNLAVDDIHAKLRDLNLRFNVGDGALRTPDLKFRSEDACSYGMTHN